MASSTPSYGPAENNLLKPSFAKVAAAAVTPRVSPFPPVKARPPVATPRNLAPPPPKRAMSVKEETSNGGAEKHGSMGTSDVAGNTATRTGEWTEWTDTAIQSAAQASGIGEAANDRPQVDAFLKVTATEDSGTQLSSSSGSGKPTSVDGKSVASAATFALDERESLRPDDSASLRAVEEEDVASLPGSDLGGARAFRDQLHEISNIIPQQHRGVPPGRFPAFSAGPQVLYDPNQPPSGAMPISQPTTNGVPAMVDIPDAQPVPDEKLLEALQSPRDRLFVIKLEQDFIDFVKEPGETSFTMPDCNSFYRLLTHRLASYYQLGHVVDTSKSSVIITRTAHTRMPPRISLMVDAGNGSSTPPVEAPVRKIMRRDDGKSGNNTTSNSGNPSKTTSEVGGSDGSNDGNEKPLTREQRAARYDEAKKRIFGEPKANEDEAVEGLEPGEEKGKQPQRAGSAAGKKKGKKPRNYDDDDFHSRSSYSAYFAPPPHPGSPYAGDSSYSYSFSAYSPGGRYSSQNSGPTPGPSGMPYPPPMSTNPQTQYGWSPQQYQAPSNPMQPNYGPMQNGYDLPNEFQRMNFQQAQATPTMGTVPMAPYQESYRPPQHAWPQQRSAYPVFGVPQNPYASAGPSNRPMPAPQGPMPSSSYGYVQFPVNVQNGNSNYNPQHPLPGSYNRPQFNPQSQAFIPGTGISPTWQQNNGSYGPYGSMNQGTVVVNHGHVPSGSSSQSFGSPPHPPRTNGNTNGGSISKYGIPANLPPKPPATMHVPQRSPGMVVNGGRV